MFYLDKIALSLFVSAQLGKIFQNETYQLSVFKNILLPLIFPPMTIAVYLTNLRVFLMSVLSNYSAQVTGCCHVVGVNPKEILIMIIVFFYYNEVHKLSCINSAALK